MDLVWNYFDKIYVLTDDLEKLEGIKNNLEYVGMTKYEIVEFENVKEVEDDIDKAIVEDNIYDIRTRMGIINMVSNQICNKRCQHQKSKMIEIIQESYEKGYENILILRDDCRFNITANYHKLLKMVDWMGKHEWDIFYLGYGQWPMMLSFLVTDSVLKLCSPRGTYAYSLSKTAIYKLNMMLNYNDFEYNEKYGLNKIYNDNRFSKYGIFPTVCYGSDSESLDKIYEKYNVLLDLKTVNRASEYISVIVPFIVCLMVCVIVYWYVLHGNIKW